MSCVQYTYGRVYSFPCFTPEFYAEFCDLLAARRARSHTEPLPSRVTTSQWDESIRHGAEPAGVRALATLIIDVPAV